MKELEIELWNAYLMEDGEILICEYMCEEMYVWSCSFSEDYLTSRPCQFITAYPLGFVDYGDLIEVLTLVKAA